MIVRRIAVALFVSLVVVGFFVALGRGVGGLDVPETPRDPVFEQRIVEEPPPIVVPPPTDEQRQTFWLRMLTTGDEHDVNWSGAQIERSGADARQAVLEAAQRSVASNPALIQQALEILMQDPQPQDFALARDVLQSRDPQGVSRAVLLLAGLGEAATPAIEQLADLASEREYPIPQYALRALLEIGTPEARDAMLDAVRRMETRQRGIGYMAVAEMITAGAGGEVARSFLQDVFELEPDPGLKLSAAEARIASGDDSVRPWLRDELARTPPGVPYHESVLRILAKHADVGVLQELTSRVSAEIDSGDRRARFLKMLAPFPLADIEPLLRRSSRPGEPVELRVQALDLLVKADASGSWSDVLSLVGAPGNAGTDDRRVGALVVGRIRRPSAGPRLIDAIRALGDVDPEGRSLLLRALLLSGHPPAADVVARAVATDATPFGVGGIGFEVSGVLGEITPEVRKALGAAVIRALGGDFGEARDSGLQFLLLYAPQVCGQEVARVIEPYVSHERREIREAAIAALAYVGTEDSLVTLRRAWRKPQDEMIRELMRDTMIKLQHRADD